MLVAVVGTFLVVELPLAVLLILLIVQNSLEIDVVDDRSYEVATLFVNMVIVLSYPLNFVIYCTMSRQVGPGGRSGRVLFPPSCLY